MACGGDAAGVVSAGDGRKTPIEIRKGKSVMPEFRLHPAFRKLKQARHESRNR